MSGAGAMPAGMVQATDPGLEFAPRAELPALVAPAGCFEVDVVHASAGTTAIREERRFQQYVRDVHTASQHAFASAGRFESLGTLLLGRKRDRVFCYR